MYNKTSSSFVLKKELPGCLRLDHSCLCLPRYLSTYFSMRELELKPINVYHSTPHVQSLYVPFLDSISWLPRKIYYTLPT